MISFPFKGALMQRLVASRTKRIAGAAVVLMALGAAGCSLRGDSGVAIIKVNDRVITAGEYRDALKRLLPPEQGASREELKELKKELVGELIEEELLLEKAESMGAAVSESALSAEVDSIRMEYGEASFKEAIEERYGSLEGWEERIRRKLLVKAAIDAIVSEVKVSEQEARAYYRDNRAEFSRPEQVRARMIVVSSEEEAAKARAGLTPANFAAKAAEVSLSPEAKEGGDLGFFGRGDMPGEFEEVVFRLRPGEISPVVKTEYGYHIFLLEGRRKAGELQYQEVREKIVERLRAERGGAALGEWIDARKRASRIEVREELL